MLHIVLLLMILMLACFRWERNKGAEKGLGLENFKMAQLSKVKDQKIISANDVGRIKSKKLI